MSSSKRPFSSSGKKNLKQGNLFSFFSKKPATPAAAAPPAQPTQSQTGRSPPAAEAAAAPKAQDPSQQVSVGSRVEVYWPDDKKYYAATVTAKLNAEKSVVTLSYDDGEVERVDLSTEKFRLLKEPSEPASKRRRIHESDDEAEFELEDSASEGDDDESAYEQDAADGENPEDEAEEDQWMVTDDEEELPKKKKKPRFQVTQMKKPAKAAGKPKSNFTTPNRHATTVTSTKKTTSTVTPPNGRLLSPSPPQGAPPPYVEGALNPAGSHLHNHFKFLKNPKDSQGRTADNPNYDPRTLKVDYSEIGRLVKKLTPASRQWWEMKAQYFDAVLFFKTGKFYELYHMDADIGVNVLGFAYMKGHIAHAGFPEIGYGEMAEKLVRAGYKVARVEQTETPEMLKQRKKKKRGGPTPQVVNREVCSILTRGTRTFCYLDGTQELTMTSTDSSAGPLLTIREVLLEHPNDGDEGEVHPVCEYGVTLVDAVRATVTIGQFADDVLRSRMNTLLAAFEPSEIIVEGGENGASPVLMSLIRSYQATSRRTVSLERIHLKEAFPKSNAIDFDVRRKMERKSPTVHPWDVKETLEEVHRRGYFPRASREQQDTLSTSRWPKVLQAAVDGNAELALSSFGASVFYLQRNLIDQDILGMGIVKAYVPPSSTGSGKASSVPVMTTIVTQQEREEDGVEDFPPPSASNSLGEGEGSPASPLVEFESDEAVLNEREINHMSLDGTTLQNLEILSNSQTYTASGSLWEKINHTKTPHGCRLLRAWLLRPLFRKGDIERRGDAVQELVSGAAAVAMEEARPLLAKCGDIERLLSRVHSMGASSPSSTSEDDQSRFHPNERAILYEGATHTKRKVGDFSKVLNDLRTVSQIPELFANIEIRSGLLQKLVKMIDDGGCFPDMVNELDWFFDNFDCDQAALGLFEPSRGVDETYDEACDNIERIERELADYKDEMCNGHLHPSHLARSKWQYKNTKVDSKDKYLIELPASVRVPDDFILKGKRGSGAKQVNKYRTPVVEQLVQELENALDIQREGKARGMQLIFSKFDGMRNLWAAAAQATAMLDALGSLAQASAKAGYTRPTILDCSTNSEPRLHIVQGKHPCVETTHSGGEFIPNDLTLGDASQPDGNQASRVLLLSGPNMGGKSTLLRQTCLIAILAQIGCFVPAEACEITPIDRIFTRLGASDRILQGQSTFFVELAETASALRGATRRSLVIMDELGRGTSTFDGTAIASASVAHLVQRNRCLTLFATHYHSVLDEWKDERSVRLGHMECYVESDAMDTENGNDEGQAARDTNITFLYTLGAGACPKSFGINVARLAGLPEELLANAKRISASFEAELNGAEGIAATYTERLRSAIQRGDFGEAEKLCGELPP